MSNSSYDAEILQVRGSVYRESWQLCVTLAGHHKVLAGRIDTSMSQASACGGCKAMLINDWCVVVCSAIRPTFMISDSVHHYQKLRVLQR